MAGVKLNLIFVIGVTILCLNSVVRQAKAIEIKCKGVDVKISEEQIMSVKECLNGGIKSMKDLTPDNAGCFSKCVMQKKELIDENGKPHKENIKKLMDANLPDAILGDWKTEMEKCLDNEGQMIKPAADDPKCQTFLPLTGCVHGAFMKICMS